MVVGVCVAGKVGVGLVVGVAVSRIAVGVCVGVCVNVGVGCMEVGDSVSIGSCASALETVGGI